MTIVGKPRSTRQFYKQPTLRNETESRFMNGESSRCLPLAPTCARKWNNQHKTRLGANPARQCNPGLFLAALSVPSSRNPIAFNPPEAIDSWRGQS